ncbi:MAG: hypothetical protein COB02_07345 [Candidatus Cloacimonadota bacterium]|nr:MAG: hypothetical protein COB02_07345 [Candidatus Cloacimonadota bacterium]
MLKKLQSSVSEPFGPDCYVYKVFDKMFALFGTKKDEIWLNLKIDPDDSICLQSEFECIIPGYHMNKKHWITIIICDEISKETVLELIDDSYDLIVSKLPKKKKNQLLT